MHHDQVGSLGGFVQKLGHGAEDERIANTVEPILSQPICLGDLLIDGICLHVVWECLMEGGVEESNAGDLRELFATETDDFQSREVVSSDRQSIVVVEDRVHQFNIQRRKILQFLKMVKCLIVDLHRLAIVSAVDDPVADNG